VAGASRRPGGNPPTLARLLKDADCPRLRVDLPAPSATTRRRCTVASRDGVERPDDDVVQPAPLLRRRAPEQRAASPTQAVLGHSTDMIGTIQRRGLG